MSSVRYRSYRQGDELKIVDLFWQVGNHPRNVSFWNWINSENPFGNSIIEVAESNGEIVGHYAVMKVDLWIQGVLVKAGFAIQAVIHKEFRNLKNLLQIAERVWDRCEMERLKFIYAFPNDNIWKVKTMLMGWNEICDFKSLEIPIRAQSLDFKKDVNEVEVDRITSFNNEFDTLWSESPIARAGKVAVMRNAKFLNWRFGKNPLQHYIYFSARTKEKLMGYIVLKLYHRKDKFYGHIVDILTVEQDAEYVANKLLKEAFKFFEWSNVDTVSCWLCPSNLYFEHLLSCGFSHTGFNTHFGYKTIEEKVPDKILNLQNWHLTMADSDAF